MWGIVAMLRHKGRWGIMAMLRHTGRWWDSGHVKAKRKVVGEQPR